MLRDIDITPGPEYLAASIRLFEEQIDKSQALIERVDDLLENRLDGMSYRESSDDMALIEAGLEALLDQEYRRIGQLTMLRPHSQRMRDGIKAAGGKPVKSILDEGFISSR